MQAWFLKREFALGGLLAGILSEEYLIGLTKNANICVALLAVLLIYWRVNSAARAQCASS